VFLFVAPPSVHAQMPAAGVLSLNPVESTVAFTISARALITVRRTGQFRDFDGDVSYDPANPANTRVDLTVYTGSVDMHNAGHERLLKSEGFLDVEHFPTMHFLSSSAIIKPDGTGSMTGDMTIRGITRQVTVPVKVRPSAAAGRAVLETNFQIDRTQFGLTGRPDAGGLNVSIGKSVQIHLAMVMGSGR
jgi:polyisoprenoid-binding protein YceI